MTTAYTPEAQACDGTVGTPDHQECGFVHSDNFPDVYQFSITDFPSAWEIPESFFHYPVETPVSPPAPDDPEPPFMFAGVFDPSGGGGEESIRIEDVYTPDNSGNDRNLTIGAGGPTGPH